MPGPMEAAEGGAPEVTVHREFDESDSNDELSPEEQAMRVTTVGVAVQSGGPSDDDSDVAALAEGRIAPPETNEEASRA